MKENSINETVSFELSRRKIKDLDKNISSSFSYDYSLSFENQTTEIQCMDYSREQIEQKRSKRLKIPNDLL